MTFFAVIKKNAKIALKGRWGAAAGIYAIVIGALLFLSYLEQAALGMFAPVHIPWDSGAAIDYAQFLRMLLSMGRAEWLITGVSSLMALLLLAPLALGITRWFYVLIQEERPAVSEIFYFFEGLRRFGRAVGYTIQLGLRGFGWGMVFLSAPAGLMSICVRFLRIETLARQSRAAASVGIVLAFGLLLLTTLLYVIYMNKYALAAYLLCESDEISAREAFRASIRYTKGYRGIIFLFTLSFAGWYLLSPFTFLLLLLFVVPYHNAGKTVLARYLVEKNRCQEPQITREFGGASLRQ